MFQFWWMCSCHNQYEKCVLILKHAQRMKFAEITEYEECENTRHIMQSSERVGGSFPSNWLTWSNESLFEHSNPDLQQFLLFHGLFFCNWLLNYYECKRPSSQHLILHQKIPQGLLNFMRWSRDQRSDDGLRAVLDGNIQSDVNDPLSLFSLEKALEKVFDGFLRFVKRENWNR